MCAVLMPYTYTWLSHETLLCADPDKSKRVPLPLAVAWQYLIPLPLRLFSAC